MTENNNNPSHPTYPPQQNAWYHPPPAFYGPSYQPHPYASAPHPYPHHPYGVERHRGDEEGEGPEEEVEEVEGGPEDDGAYDEEERREDEDETLQLSEDFLEGTAEPTASIIAPSCMRAREPAEMKVINSLTLLNIITRIVKKVVQKCPGDLMFSKQMFIRNNWLSKQTYTLGFKAKLITQFLVTAVQQYQLLDTDESDLQTLHKVKVLPKAFALAKVKMPRGHATTAAQNVRAVHTPPHLLHPSSHSLPHTHTPPHSSSTSSHTPPRKRMGHPKRSPLLITGKAGEKEEEKGREERGREEEGQLSVVEVVDVATEIPTNTNNTNANNTNNVISNTTTTTSSTTNTNNSTNNDDTEEEDIVEKPNKEGENDKAKSRERKRSFTDINELDIDTEEELDPVPSSSSSSLPSSHPTLPTSPLPHSPSIPIEHLSKSIRATRTPPVPHSSSLPIPIASPSLPFPVSTPPTGAGNRAVRPIAIKHEPPVEFVDEYGYQYYMYDTQSNKKRARGVSPFNASRANGHAPTYKNPPVQSAPSPYAYPPTPYAPYPSYAHAPYPAHASHPSHAPNMSHTSLLPSPSPHVPPPTERDSWTEFLARVGRTEESVKGWPIDAVREELELQNFRGAKKGDVLNFWHSLQG